MADWPHRSSRAWLDYLPSIQWTSGLVGNRRPDHVAASSVSCQVCEGEFAVVQLVVQLKECGSGRWRDCSPS